MRDALWVVMNDVINGEKLELAELSKETLARVESCAMYKVAQEKSGGN